MGHRTCSASEQVINGLRALAWTWWPIGDTTCGKPVGFLPADDGCGTTYSAVNFESVNARVEGRYFDGFAPTERIDASDTCRVADDFTTPLGAPDGAAARRGAAARGHGRLRPCAGGARTGAVGEALAGRRGGEPAERGHDRP